MLRAEARELPQALDFLRDAVQRAPIFNEVLLYDPVPMRLARLKNRERAQLLVESKSRPALQNFLTQWMAALYARRTPRELRWHLDVDPLEF
jgi:primosomal protein N' (replication factor Y)